MRILIAMKSTRLIEIDALRGLAVLSMVVFHAMVDAHLLGIMSFDPFSWPWRLGVIPLQVLFLGLVGLSLVLSSRGFGEQLKRGVWVFACGFLVTLSTWVLFPDDYVRFGILQCIGVSIPLAYGFKRRPGLAIPVALAVLGIGLFLATIRVGGEWFLALGLYPVGFSSLDYFPLFPWFAAVLGGVWVGSRVYAQRRPTRLAILGKIPGISLLGRHSLVIYLLHQPVLYFSLWALSHWNFL